MKLKNIIGSTAAKWAACLLATVSIGSAWAEEINVIDVPELTVTTLDPADDSLDWRGQLTPVNVALHYELSADVLAAHQEELAAIANWKIDWVLTSSEDLTLVNPRTALPSGMTLEQVDASSEGGCISGKMSEDVEWVYAPFSGVFQLSANTEYRVYNQIVLGGGSDEIGLEASSFVQNKGFGCALYLTSAYRMAHPNVVITLQPYLYHPSDSSVRYSLGEAKRFTFGLPDAPKAVVTKNAAYNKEVNLVNVNDILSGGYQYGTVTPNVAYTFEAKDTPEEASSGAYSNWKCDYIVSMDADTDAYSIGLFGQYGWGAVAFPSPVDAKAGQKIPLLMSVTKNGWNYSDIVSMVRSFTCGAINFSEENIGKTITVSLVMWNEDNPVYKSYENPYVVEEIKYKFETVTPLFASVSQGAPAVPVVYRKNTADEYGFSVNEDGYPVTDDNGNLVVRAFAVGEPHFAMVADNAVAKTSDSSYSTADEAVATVVDNKEITVNISTSIGSEAAPAGSTVTTTTGTAVTAGTDSAAETTVTPKTVTITSGTGSEQTVKTVEAYVVSQGSGEDMKFSVVTDVSKDETIVSAGKTVVSDFVKPAEIIAKVVASENLEADKVSSMVLSLVKTEAESSEPGLDTALVTAIGAADKAFEVHPVATITTTTEEGTTATTSYAVANSELAEDASFTFTLDFGVENAGKLVTLTHYASDGVIKQHNGKDSWTESLDANGIATVTLSEFSYLLGTLSEEPPATYVAQIGDDTYATFAAAIDAAEAYAATHDGAYPTITVLNGATEQDNTRWKIVDGYLVRSYFYKDDSNANLWHIANLDGLIDFRKSVNNKNAYIGKTIQLDADIDMAGVAWLPIGGGTTEDADTSETWQNYYFAGTFDGQNHVISNLTVALTKEDSRMSNRVGLFGFVNGGTVKDLVIENVDLTGGWYVAPVAGRGVGATFSGITVRGTVNVDAIGYASGLVANAYTGNVRNCVVNGTLDISGEDGDTGGIAGGGYANISDCVVVGVGDSVISGGEFTGGIKGYSGEGNVKVESCSVSNVTVVATSCGAGGVFGCLQYGNRVIDCNVYDVTVVGNKPINSGVIGLIAGSSLGTESSPSFIYGCSVSNSTATVDGMQTFSLCGDKNWDDESNGNGYVYFNSDKTSTVNNNTVALTNGTYTASPETAVAGKTAVSVAYTAKSYVAEGYAVTDNGNGTWTIGTPTPVAMIYDTPYYSLADAVLAAYEWDEIFLLADITLDSTLVLDKSLYINGAEDGETPHTLTGTVKVSAAADPEEYVSVEISNLVFGEGSTIDVSDRGDGEDDHIYFSNVAVEAGSTITIVAGELDGRKILIDSVGSLTAANFTATLTSGYELVKDTGALLAVKYVASVVLPRTGTRKCESIAEAITFADAFGVDEITILDAEAVASAPAGWKIADGKLVRKVYVAQVVGGQSYETIAEAIAAASEGGTVQVLVNCSIDAHIDVTKNLTLDLNGKTVANNVNYARAIDLNADGVALTVKANGGGMVIAAGNSYGFFRMQKPNVRIVLDGGFYRGHTDGAALFRYNNSDQSMVLSNVTAEAVGSALMANYILGSAGHYNNLEIVGGSFMTSGTNPYTYDSEVFRLYSMNGSIKDAAIVCNITSPANGYNGCINIQRNTGSEFVIDGCAISNLVAKTASGQNTWASCLTVAYDAHVKVLNCDLYSAQYGVYVFSSGATVELENSNLKADYIALYSQLAVNGSNGDNAVSSGIIKVKSGLVDGTIRAEYWDFDTSQYVDFYAAGLQIEGGKFKNFVVECPDTPNTIMAISGGVFDHPVIQRFCAENYEPADNTDALTKDEYPYTVALPAVAQIGTTKYESLAAAFSAAQDGDTVQLLKDCETGAAYTHANPLVFNTANATLDLNGKTLTITYNMSLVFRCSNGVVKNGTIVPGVTDSNVSGDWCRYGLTIDSCTGVKVSDVVSTTGIAVGGDPEGGYTPGAGPATDVVFERCTVTGRSTRYAVFAQNQSTATIKDGTYNANTANEGVLYANFGSNDGGAGILKVTGGSFMGAITQNNAGAIVISGGIFSKQPAAGLAADGYEVVDNTDAETKDDYPYTVAPKAYTVTFEKGAESDPDFTVAETKFTVVTGVEVLPMPTYNSDTKTFAGWTVKNGEGDVITALPAGTTGDITLVATWTGAKTIQINAGGTEPTTIKVTDEWLEANGLADEEDTAVIKAALEAPVGGVPRWESYVLGQSIGAAVSSDAEQGETTLMPVTSTIDVPAADTGFDVQYRLDVVKEDGTIITAGTPQDTPDLAVELSEISGSAYYKLTAVVTAKDESGASVTVPADNTIGVLKVESGAKTTAIAVPWEALGGGDISVSNIVRTATLTPGDELKAYAPDGKYKAWELDANKCWQPVTVVGGSSETGADAFTVPRGSAVWLTRQDTTQPIYLVGEVAATEKAEVKLEAGTTTNPSWNLVGSAGTEPVNVNEIGAATTDKIIVPTATVPKNYEYNTEKGEWGYWDYETVVKPNGRKTVTKVWKTAEDIPAGTGFWYLNGGVSKDINL